MVNLEYANAYSEVLSILNHIPEEDYKRIPISKIEFFETNKNIDYKFDYNSNKTLEQQNVSKRAKAIIALLFRDYWATEEQKEKILRKQNYHRQILEESKKSLYNVENMFKNNVSVEETQDKKEISIYKESFFKKILNIIRVFFKKR